MASSSDQLAASFGSHSLGTPSLTTFGAPCFSAKSLARLEASRRVSAERSAAIFSSFDLESSSPIYRASVSDPLSPVPQLRERLRAVVLPPLAFFYVFHVE